MGAGKDLTSAVSAVPWLCAELGSCWKLTFSWGRFRILWRCVCWCPFFSWLLTLFSEDPPTHCWGLIALSRWWSFRGILTQPQDGRLLILGTLHWENTCTTAGGGWSNFPDKVASCLDAIIPNTLSLLPFMFPGAEASPQLTVSPKLQTTPARLSKWPWWTPPRLDLLYFLRGWEVLRFLGQISPKKSFSLESFLLLPILPKPFILLKCKRSPCINILNF